MGGDSEASRCTEARFSKDCECFYADGEEFFFIAIRPRRLQKEVELFGRTLLAYPFLSFDPQRPHLVEVFRFMF